MTRRSKPARPTIFIDTDEGPRVIRQEKGERINFLYDAFVQARAHTDADVRLRAEHALYVEIYDYCGVVLRKETNKRGHNLPGVDTADDDMRGPTDYRRDGGASPRLDQLLDPIFRQDAATMIFLKLDTFKGKSAFHTWAYRVIANEIMDAIEKRMKYLTVRPTSFVNIPSAEDAAGTASGASGAAMTRNNEELRTVHGLNAAMLAESPQHKAEFMARRGPINKLYHQQSVEDRLFITMKVDEAPDLLIAKELNWPIKKVYNRTAKFKKLGLLLPKPVDPKKQMYNQRARAKLAKSN